jgi:hypothetical protein
METLQPTSYGNHPLIGCGVVSRVIASRAATE